MNHHNSQPPIHPEFVACPSRGDDAHGRIGIHSQQERRYKCHQCGKTFAEMTQREVCRGQVDLGQVQGDELYVRSQCDSIWIATSMTVFSRLFVWGAVSVERGAALVSQVVTQTRAAALPGRSILWVVNGFAGWV